MNHVVESYENYREEDRLTTDNARRIEFLSTVKALEKVFPKDANILDCAAGTGIYSFYFAEKGYDVTAMDITPRHIKYINTQLKSKEFVMETAINDACNLSCLSDEMFDIVLCMGPIYHLTDETLRLTCINECKRVLKTGGLLVVAYINKFFVIPQIIKEDKKYLKSDLIQAIVKSGAISHDNPDCFWTDSYLCSPEIMENFLCNIDMEIVDHLATDGISTMLSEQINNLNEHEFNVWCEYNNMVCREKSIMGISNHGLIIGRK